MGDYFGWDIGGVHIKFAKLTAAQASASILTRVVPFEIWKDPDGLVPRLRSLLDDRPGKHGVTMTAELSDLYPTRADGVRSILRACAQALPGPPRILDVRGGFLSVDEALDRPLEVAAANWVGTARLVARARRDALLIDVGSTTTDIVPIRAGEPRPAGRTDTERLLSGELVYSGVLRTPPSSLTDVVPLHGMWCRVSPEHFTIMGDVYRILEGEVAPVDCTAEDYLPGTCNRDAVCLSRDIWARVQAAVLGVDHPPREAAAVAVGPAGDRHSQVLDQERHAAERPVRKVVPPPAVSAGAGAFLAEEAARRAGLEVTGLARLATGIAGDGWPRAAPAAAIAVLLAEEAGVFRFTP